MTLRNRAHRNTSMANKLYFGCQCREDVFQLVKKCIEGVIDKFINKLKSE